MLDPLSIETLGAWRERVVEPLVVGCEGARELSPAPLVLPVVTVLFARVWPGGIRRVVVWLPVDVGLVPKVRVVDVVARVMDVIGGYRPAAVVVVGDVAVSFLVGSGGCFPGTGRTREPDTDRGCLSTVVGLAVVVVAVVVFVVAAAPVVGIAVASLVWEDVDVLVELRVGGLTGRRLGEP